MSAPTGSPGDHHEKRLASKILPELEGRAPVTGRDASTNGPIDCRKEPLG